MNRERILAGGVAVVVVASLLAAALVPGAVAQSREEVVRPGPVDVSEILIAHGPVSGASATLSVETRLEHRGNPTENVTLLLRAVDLESGMVETTQTIDVEKLSGDREVAVPADITVAREGGYRIETILLQDDRRVDEGSKQVQGLESLTPEYASTSIEFHRFGGDLPAVEYAIADVEGNQTTLDVSSYLTNAGDDPAGDLRLVVTARQSDSKIVADRASVDVGEIEPGRTATPSAELSVPDGYNYYLDAVLWKDGVVVGTYRSAANLNPTETISVEETTQEIGLEVSDFEGSAGNAEDRSREQATSMPESGQPGFGVTVAILAFLGATLLYWRRDQ